MSAETAYKPSSDTNLMHFEIEKLKELGFRQGMLLRVKMVNFLTYDDCEVFPGPKLNVILGPNGTGKSTITHAVCLACAGSPNTVGRSLDLKQFVKKGKEGEESYVEIDVLSNGVMKTAKTMRIRRTINSEKKSSKWYKDGKNSSEKEIKAIVKALNIDVDNLCTFMAQDKVGDFTTQTNTGMLERTLQSIEAEDEENNPIGKTLYDVQQELNDIELTKTEKNREVAAKRNQHDQVVVQLESMTGEVERVQRRGQTIELKKKYEIKLAVVRSTHLKNEVSEQQTIVNEAVTALNDAKNAIIPLEEEVRNLKRQLQLLEKNEGSSKKTLQQTEEIISTHRKEMHKMTLKMEDSVSEIEHLISQRKENEMKKAELEKLIEESEQRVKNIKESLPECTKKVLELKEVEKGLRNEKDVLDEATRDLRLDADDLDRKCKVIDKQIGQFQDPKQVYKTKLLKSNDFKDEVRMIDFMEVHKHEFKKEVFGPVGLHLKVSDTEASRLVNDAIGRMNLNTFIVQTDHDADLLRSMKGTRSSSNNVRIVVIKNIDLDVWNRVGSGYSKETRQSFAAFGFRNHLRNFIECNDLIKTYLGSNCRAAIETLYARTSSKDSLTDAHLSALCPGSQGMDKAALYLVFSSANETTKYNLSFSKHNHSQGRITSSRQIQDVINFLVKGESSGDDGDQERLENERQELREAKKQKLADIVVAERKCTEKEHEIVEVVQKLKNHKKVLNSLKPEEDRLVVAMSKLAKVKTNLSGNIDKVRLKSKKTYEEAVHAILDSVEVVTARSTDCVNLSVGVALEDESRNALNSAIELAETSYEDAKRGLGEFEEKKRDAERNIEDKKQQLQDALEELKQRKSEFSGQTAFVKYYQEEVNVPGFCPENTVEQLEERVAALERQITGTADNAGIIERHEAAKQEEVALKKALDKLEDELEYQERHVEKRSKQWITQVERIIGLVNKNFGANMKELQFEGEVRFLRKGTFSEYELQLWVSFKNNQEISVLDGQKQSGGERAVSTIMYLMALQHLISSPFRTVDEINQGMDERNERIVFDQIVRSSTGPKINSQYFLVSPKLLQGLRSMEHEDVTVLMIWNGPGVRSKWQISDIIAKIQNKKRRWLADVTNDSDLHASSKRARGVGN